ncbi:MAG: beta-ketoacyl-[acyl-carrier-protein] synthase family protein [Acetobacteraceae bacterium]|jgi:3-oxoacyl-[acyl-carrier-protein] synthase I
MQPLALSHMCIVSSVGFGQDATVSALESGRSGLRPCRFESIDLPTWTGEIEALDNIRLPAAYAPFECRNNRLAEIALAQDGFADAVRAAVERYGADRIGLFLGTSTSGIAQTEHAFRARDKLTGNLPDGFHYEQTHNTGSLAAFMRVRLGIMGPAFVVSCACASSAKAFGNASRMIASGLCDAAVVGGADSLCLTTLYGFHSLNLNSPGPCRPFDAHRDGISIGEAAGFVLLERTPRDDADRVYLLGVGESNDAHHMSSPHPEGAGARLAMERALGSAGLRPRDIDYINLHGTATRVGDVAEDNAVFGLFGEAPARGSTKGHTGHTLGAAGVIEAIISALAIRDGLLPGSPHTETIDPAFRGRYQVASERAKIDRVLSNSFGFGGSNCSLVLGRAH